MKTREGHTVERLFRTEAHDPVCAGVNPLAACVEGIDRVLTFFSDGRHYHDCDSGYDLNHYSSEVLNINVLFDDLKQKNETLVDRLTVISDRYAHELNDVPAIQAHAAIDARATFLCHAQYVRELMTRFNDHVDASLSGDDFDNSRDLPWPLLATMNASFSDFGFFKDHFLAIELPEDQLIIEKAAINDYCAVLNRVTSDIQCECRVMHASAKEKAQECAEAPKP